jgi:hypothetical protein
MQWGILNNLIGVRHRVPHIKLPDALVSEESAAFHFWRDAMRRVSGRGTALGGIQTPDANPIMHYHYHRSEAGLEYLFGFTKANAYLWNEALQQWDLFFTCVSDCTTWSTETFGTYVVATNNLDLVQYWSDTTPAVVFAPIGGVDGILYNATDYLTKAAVVKKHWNYLHLMNVEKNGVRYSNYDQWCDAGDATSWREDHPTGGDANYRALGPNDTIIGAGIYNVQGANQLIVFTDNTVNAAWLVEDDLVYEAHDLLTSTGVSSADSIVQTPDGNLYYLSGNKQGIREIRKVYDVTSLSYDIQPTLNMIPANLASGASAAYVAEYQEIWWAIPSTSASTGNDLVLIYNLGAGAWQPNLPISIVAFGFYRQQSAVYIDSISTLIDDLTGTIDSMSPSLGEPQLLCSDDGYTWHVVSDAHDKGADLSGQLVLAITFGATINEYKRIHGAWFYFESSAGTSFTATISLRAGDGAQYTNLGTVSIAGDGRLVRQWLLMDEEIRDGHLKIAVSNPCDFLGVVFDYDPRGSNE